MAINVTTGVWALRKRTSGLTATEKAVLLCLAEHAHQDGAGAFPAVRTIADETFCSRRGVQKALRVLEAKGFIRPVGHRPRGQVNYAINLAALPDRERYSQSDRPQRTTFAAGVNDVRPGGEPRSPESSVEPSREPEEERDRERGSQSESADDMNSPEAWEARQRSRREWNQRRRQAVFGRRGSH